MATGTAPRKRKPSTATPAKRTRRRTPAKKVVAKRRRRKVSKKSLLSEFMSPAVARGASQKAISGTIGGGLGFVIDKFITPVETKPGLRAGILVGAGFLMSGMAGKPDVGAGIAGAGGFLLAEHLAELTMNDGYDYADELEAMPLILDENGNAMTLQDNNMSLQDAGYQVSYAPSFSNPL